MHKLFKNKTVVITGATGGIGRALAWQFANAGSRLVLIDLEASQLSALENQLEHLGSKVVSHVCDISDHALTQQTFLQIASQMGHIDILINNAGIKEVEPFESTTLTSLHRMMDVNYFGAVNCTYAALPYLKESAGVIMTIGSLTTLYPQGGMAGYIASKNALTGFFDTLAIELADSGMSVMLIHPGYTNTDLHKRSSRASELLEVASSRTTGILSADSVAEMVFNQIVIRKRRVIINNQKIGYCLLHRFFPKYYDKLMYKLYERSTLSLTCHTDATPISKSET